MLDPQIKSYKNLHHQFLAAQSSTADIGARILTAYNVLDQIIDLYYAAENKVKQTMEGLPVGVTMATASSTIKSTGYIQTASINRSDLILEDWLAELLYKDDVK